MDLTKNNQITRYDIDLLNKIMIRDEAKLIGSYESLNVGSVIKFLCKCSKEGSKKFRGLYDKGGAFCKECAKINGKKKSEATNLEKFGVINPFMLKEVQDKINTQTPNLLIIDVREDNEWQTTGHLPSAIHLARGIIERDISRFATKNNELILYCSGGFRSVLAADNLQKMGYSVYSMSGGMKAWLDAKLPVSE
jgi:rhodanese-related sulfurtransferase